MDNTFDFIRSRLDVLDHESIFVVDQHSSVDDAVKKGIRMLSKKSVPIPVRKMPMDEILLMAHVVENSLSDEQYGGAVTACTAGLRLCLPYSGYANIFYNYRSIALENLGLYRESLSDIDRTIEIEGAVVTLDDLRARKQKLQQKIASARPRVDNDKSERDKYFNEVPVLSGEENKVIPGASDAIGVVYDWEYGCNFVAKKLIEAGYVIFIERPYVTCVIPKRQLLDDAICDHCHKTTKAPIPCDYCTIPLYCSKECLRKAYETYGNFECNFIGEVPPARMAIKILLAITRNGAKLEEAIKYCEELDAMDDDAIKNLNDSNEVPTEDMKWILNLSLRMKKSWAIRSSTILNSTGLALMIRNFSTYMQGSNDVVRLAKLLLRIHFIVDTYVLEIENPNFENPRAHGLYRLQSMVCHSCYSNTIYTVHKDNVVALRATRDIKPNEKISYNSLHANLLNLRWPTRKMILLTNSNFACKCIACTKQYNFKPEIGKKLDVPKGLQRKLRGNKKDINSMWELLKLINDEIQRPCFEAEVMKIIIRDTYLGRDTNNGAMWVLYIAIGVL